MLTLLIITACMAAGTFVHHCRHERRGSRDEDACHCGGASPQSATRTTSPLDFEPTRIGPGHKKEKELGDKRPRDTEAKCVGADEPRAV